MRQRLRYLTFLRGFISSDKLDPRTGTRYKLAPLTLPRAAPAQLTVHTTAELQVLNKLFAEHEALKGPNPYIYTSHEGAWNWRDRRYWLSIFGQIYSEEAENGIWMSHAPNDLHGGNIALVQQNNK